MGPGRLTTNRAPAVVTWDSHRAVAADWRPPPVATTVVVPHPDDEALLFGGIIQHQRRRGIAVRVIAVTDGEAAYDDVDPVLLAAARRREQETALGLLGVPTSEIIRLGLPDGGLDDHETAIAHAIHDIGHGCIVAPWVHDHHRDHEACGRAALEAGRRRGTEVAGGLFWAWHHTHPGQLSGRLARLHLDDDQRRAKRAAVDVHVSQLVADTPVLTAELLTPVSSSYEYFVTSGGRPDHLEAAR